MAKLLKHILLDILNNKIVIVYTIVLAAFSWSVFGLEDNTAKGILTLLNILLLIVPLVASLFATIYLYNSNEFIELLLSQPVKRSLIWKSLFAGLSGSLSIAFLLGVAIPVLLFAELSTALVMIASGLFLTVIFVSIAFLANVFTRDKAKGIGLAIMGWLYFALLFDAIVLFLFFQFADYPIEKVVVLLSALSPIDLCRINILLHLDVSAMMGYTGAIFRDYFGAGGGLILSSTLLLLWAFVPFYISLIRFKNKDL
ncbi:MAG TPA: ABC transporter permease subunit [Flavihumibacter sp.]|nr:ABC transporter permease [Bacteroidota bacterium]HOA39529.1 ABC transporter permease subunit [Flavihumibacter sp.]HQD09663.1 ABC transporter permease subunit [Flavihumibacter sp.]